MLGPISYVDPAGLQQRPGPPGMGGGPYDPNVPNEFDCTTAKIKCSELREIWAKAGHGFTTALFDKFLAKAGCASGGVKPAFDANTLVPGINQKIADYYLTQQALWALISKSMKSCKDFKLNTSTLIELLPTIQVINFPGGGTPLTDLDDLQYAIGSISLSIDGLVKTEKDGCCCDATMRFNYSGADAFSFHPSFGRGIGGFGANPFAKFYRACTYLQSNCGYCAVEWKVSGSGTAKSRKCWHNIPASTVF